MKKVVLVQLPIPQLCFGAKTGNIPLGAACLKAAVSHLDLDVEIIPESLATYSSDSVIIDLIKGKKPDVLGFTVYSWNIDRVMCISEQLKKSLDVRIIFGGPEITPDNDRLRTDLADFMVFGEGEETFLRLLSEEAYWERRIGSECSERIFCNAKSPYFLGLLEPGIEEMMLLETQRGCPYRCGYCYYSKSRKGLAFVDQDHLVTGFEWALYHEIPEIFLLDPSLDSRRGLDGLLSVFAKINGQKKIKISSEIRADMIDPTLADLLERSGFAGFEMGLQTINPEPLRVMNRKTDLERFVRGVNLVKERGIDASIDLIIGLPGDSAEGFMRSVDFVERHGFEENIQVFPLSVLPGTDFRQRSSDLGLFFEPDPPYTIRSSSSFSEEDLLECLDYAEDRFDVSIYPVPDIDASWHAGDRKMKDTTVTIGGRELYWKIMLDDARSLDEIERISGRLTHPYQVFVKPGMKDRGKILKALSILSSKNPFTPLEIIFLSMDSVPDYKELLNACMLKRPHFLDNDLRFLYPDPGNRAFLITQVCSGKGLFLEDHMCRNVFLWNLDRLPLDLELEELHEYDGVLIDSLISLKVQEEWQDRISFSFENFPEITFSDIRLQLRWLLLTRQKNYSAHVLENLL